MGEINTLTKSGWKVTVSLTIGLVLAFSLIGLTTTGQEVENLDYSTMNQLVERIATVDGDKQQKIEAIEGVFDGIINHLSQQEGISDAEISKIEEELNSLKMLYGSGLIDSAQMSEQTSNLVEKTSRVDTEGKIPTSAMEGSGIGQQVREIAQTEDPKKIGERVQEVVKNMVQKKKQNRIQEQKKETEQARVKERKTERSEVEEVEKEKRAKKEEKGEESNGKRKGKPSQADVKDNPKEEGKAASGPGRSGANQAGRRTTSVVEDQEGESQVGVTEASTEETDRGTPGRGRGRGGEKSGSDEDEGDEGPGNSEKGKGRGRG
ncbi:MAG: hypothetical protein ABEJ25_07010 [Candidatus Bipolaricaulia bacterium]